ncbi:2TM domain-containing protein [Muricauda sp. CAU 1633]|uniref:2TM domain-containing protein n=1 Tax=Allomuricauda sp. CAU 1633 TaxID=2816036 RepID=UPI001A8C9563|nr:2TM domain-containing protein [Muricauda sp. CAU 1633]MBO0322352.1 2TM domain-containing protein [Muricauda sp. CAU 1633]
MENLDEIRYIKAKEQVEKIKSFYSSLLAYCIVIPILAYVNYRTTNFPWAIFPAMGWGIGLVFLWMCAKGYNPILGKDWEDRKIQELMKDKNF